MNAEYFLDTNVLVYAFSTQDEAKQSRATQLLTEGVGGKGAISWQVVQEFLSLATSRNKVAANAGELQGFLLRALVPMCVVWPSPALWQESLNMQRVTQYRFYDSMIVAAALESGAAYLYSEDLQHGRKLGDLEIRNPFRS